MSSSTSARLCAVAAVAAVALLGACTAPPAPVEPATSVTEVFSVSIGNDDSIELSVIGVAPRYVGLPRRYSFDLTLEEQLLSGTVQPLTAQTVLIDDTTGITDDGGPNGRGLREVHWPNDHTLTLNADVIACVQVIEHRPTGDVAVSPDECRTLVPSYL